MNDLRGYGIGYARVSTTEQDSLLQHDALTVAGCQKIFTDSSSGTLTERPQLKVALEYLRPGDTLVVWRLDRLGRSLRHLIDVVEDLDARGIGFRSLRESIDTATSGGRLAFHIFGALAEFERELIREGSLAGLGAAGACGRVRRPAGRHDAGQAALGAVHARRGAARHGDRCGSRCQSGDGVPQPRDRDGRSTRREGGSCPGQDGAHPPDLVRPRQLATCNINMRMQRGQGKTAPLRYGNEVILGSCKASEAGDPGDRGMLAGQRG